MTIFLAGMLLLVTFAVSNMLWELIEVIAWDIRQSSRQRYIRRLRETRRSRAIG